MTRSLLFLVSLTACGTVDGADTPERIADPVTIPVDVDVDVDDLSRVDVRGTAQSITRIAQKLERLDPDAREQAAASLRVLSVNDPFTRAAMQLPYALHAAVMDIDAQDVDRFVQRDWQTLQDGLTTHVAVLTSLGVDLPLPAPGDGLYGAEPGWMVDRDTLLASSDPVGATRPLVRGMLPLAEGIDPATVALIDEHSARVEALTGVVRPCPRVSTLLPGQSWTLGMQLGGWHDALRRIEPFVTDPGLKSRIGDIIAVLDTHDEAAFVTHLNRADWP